MLLPASWIFDSCGMAKAGGYKFYYNLFCSGPLTHWSAPPPMLSANLLKLIILKLGNIYASRFSYIPSEASHTAALAI